MLFLLCAMTAGMCAFAQNPKREVVFTLRANEVIYADEYYLMQFFNQNRFSCMIENTVTKEFTFVFNGKRIKAAPHWISSVDVTQDNSYIVAYEEDGKYYVNCKGVVEGGFEDMILTEQFYSGAGYLVKTNIQDFDYQYKLAGKWYAHKNGKNKKVEFFIESGNDYMNINGNISNMYKWAYDITVTEDGQYAYIYEDKGNRKKYINNNGRISGGYSNIDNLRFCENGKYGYSYYNDGQWYININGRVDGTLQNISNLRLTENGKYAYTYYDEGGWYLNVNGRIYSGFDDIENVTLTENGKYSYSYYKDGKWYVNNNGYIELEKRTNDWDYDDDFELYSKNDEHFFHSSYQYEYVVIDGKPYGKSPASRAWYDEKRNAFIWTAIEAREIVVYENKLY